MEVKYLLIITVASSPWLHRPLVLLLLRLQDGILQQRVPASRRCGDPTEFSRRAGLGKNLISSSVDVADRRIAHPRRVCSDAGSRLDGRLFKNTD